MTTIKDFGLAVESNHPLAPYTYMKVGGPAKFFAVAHTQKDLIQLVKTAAQEKLPILILGGGSNVVISDRGFSGLAIKNRTDTITRVTESPPVIRAESGVIVNHLVNYTVNQGLAGLEEFLGIPGTVGGAVFNNSHHLKHLIGDYIARVDVITRTGQQKTLEHPDLDFAYDYSVLQETGDIILSADFRLTPGDTQALRSQALAALKRRRDTQPLEYPSSGCMFKNIGEKNARKFHTPDGATSAGFLIDRAGLKGLQVGGAKISDKHANFIINTGDASAADIKELSDRVIQKIKQAYGVTLEREVFFIGDS